MGVRRGKDQDSTVVPCVCGQQGEADDGGCCRPKNYGSRIWTTRDIDLEYRQVGSVANRSFVLTTIAKFRTSFPTHKYETECGVCWCSVSNWHVNFFRLGFVSCIGWQEMFLGARGESYHWFPLKNLFPTQWRTSCAEQRLVALGDCRNTMMRTLLHGWCWGSLCS